MRLSALVLSTLVLATTLAALAPAAEAAPPCWYAADKIDCAQDLVDGRCIVGYTYDCIVRNPCDPRMCDVWWPGEIWP